MSAPSPRAWIWETGGTPVIYLHAAENSEPLYDAAALEAAVAAAMGQQIAAYTAGVRRQALEDAAHIVKWHNTGSSYRLRDELAAAIRALMEKP